MGVLNVAAMPAPAPHASSTLRSAAVVETICPITDPNAPPVWMIGPSAPNGPPVPMAMAAESGFRMATFASMRLLDVSTASIASGMPWPLILGEPYLAITPTDQATDDGNEDDPGSELIGLRAAETKRPDMVERKVGKQADQIVEKESNHSRHQTDDRRKQ